MSAPPPAAPYAPSPPATLAEAILRVTRDLESKGVDAPRFSAELLAARAFGLTRLGLILHANDQPDAAGLAAFASLAERRGQGEPVAYLLGEKEFFGLNFRITPDVLIPRPETELIIEQAQRLFAQDAPLRFADFGTGSGALAVALAHVFPAAHGLAVDLSTPALEIARQNAQANGVSSRIVFLRADFTRLALASSSLDLLVSNPPYVTQDEYEALSPEVRSFEPRMALVSADQGLWHLRGLLSVAARALRPGGCLLCELGSGQGRAALELLAGVALGFEPGMILKDYAGLDRVLMARRNSQKYLAEA